MAKMLPRILLIDDDEVFQRLLAELLDDGGRLSLVWESTGQRGIEALQRGRFDLVIVDYQLPDMLGTEVFDAIDKMADPPRRVMFTGYASVNLAVDAMKRGAMDFFTKPLKDPGAFVRFINRTLSITPPLPLPQPLVSSASGASERASAAAHGDTGHALPSATEIRRRALAFDPPVDISVREGEVIAAVIEGLANKEIASALHLSEQTVKNHLSSIYHKLGVASRAQLIRKIM